MKFINVKLKNNPYHIVFSNTYNDLISYMKKNVPNKKLFFISDTNVEPLYLKEIVDVLKKEKFEVNYYVFKAGEQSKNIKTLVGIYEYALKIGIDRKTTVVALGGGVVGDTAGFFASTYMRGIDFIQIPTTLLAMVDSSIGGKTGVNLESGKNIVGAFYQPKFVYINSKFLETIPLNHIKNGMGEVIKYAITFSSKFFNKLSSIFDNSVITRDDFDYIIYECCKFKAAIVEEDEKEKSGVRELLNFGHTFAHALETITKYKKYLHGEAVAIGMLFVADLAYRTGICNENTKEQIENIVINAGFDVELNLKAKAKDLLDLMKKDKKSISKAIKFVLPLSIGKAQQRMEVDDSIIIETIKDFLK